MCSEGFFYEFGLSANLGDVFFEVRSITSEFCGVNLRIVLSSGSFDFFGEGLTLVFKFFLEVDTTKPVVANRIFGELFPLFDGAVRVNAKGCLLYTSDAADE